MDYIKLYILILGCAFYCWGCNSSEYDLDEYTINTTEKKVVVDTIKKVTDNQEKKETTQKNENFVFVVQIGAFFIKSNFDAFFEKAKQVVGNDVYFVSTSSLYKIRVGSYTNKSDALKELEKVTSLGYTDAFVITTRK